MFASCKESPIGKEESITKGKTIKTLEHDKNELTWVFATMSKDHDEYYINNKYVSKEEGLTKIWGKILRKKSVIAKKVYENTETKILYEFDCIGQRLRQIEAAVYSSTGDVILNGRLSEDWMNIPPESIFEALSLKVCEMFNSQ